MWRAFRLWLHQFNPVAIWREERRLDRVAQLELVSEFASALRANADVATQALDLTNRFLKNFEVAEAPQSYVVREEDEIKAAAERYGIDYTALDPDNNPFSFTS